MRADWLHCARVTVRVNGRDLKEYQAEPTDEEDPTKITAYVECVAGAEFSVYLLLEPGFPFTRDHLNFSVSVDGKCIASKIVPLSSIGWQVKTGQVLGETKQVNGASTLRKMKFAAHEMTDAKPKKTLDPKAMAQLGDIQVKLTRCRELGTDNTDTKASFQAMDKNGIPEKALKGRAISNHAELGASTRVTTTWVNCAYPYGTAPIATYVFKYRSHKDLQIEGIIPRSPSPVPLEERDPDTLTQEEARELIIRMRAKEQNAVKIKQEFKREKRRHSAVSAETGDNDDEEGDISITGEFDRRKRARPENSIDLTADD